MLKNIEDLFFLDKKFYTMYEPVYSISTDTIIAYEALARFQQGLNNIPADILFSNLNDEKMVFELEKKIKKFQLDNRPKKSQLFLNLDPRTLYKKEKVMSLKRLFEGKRDVYLELTPNINIENIKKVKMFIEECKGSNIHVGLDNFGNQSSAMYLDLLYIVDFIKLDRVWINYLREDMPQKALLKGIIELTNELNTTLVMEGIESKKDLKLAKDIGIELVQGYYFKKEFIKRVSCF
jgi:EAL domain-containing protein (putative c-di-GMP-specific phosphodiesterase class I)